MVLDGISGLITLTYLPNCDYLLFRVCFFGNPTLLQSLRVNGNRLSLQPDIRFFYTSVHFRMLNSGCIIPFWTLLRLSFLHLGHPEEYVAEDSLLSKTNLILLAWDSVPYRSYEGSILV